MNARATAASAPGRVQLRLEAARAAIEITRPIEECFGTDAVLGVAEQLYAWLTRPVSLSLSFGPVVEPSTGALSQPLFSSVYFTGATYMSNLQLGDSQQVSATAVALDADGQPTTDALTWTASVATAVSLTPSSDTMSCVVAGLVPTVDVVITATDTLGNSTTGTLDVVSGPATSLSLQFGPVTDRTPAAGDASGAGTTPAASATPDAGTASA